MPKDKEKLMGDIERVLETLRTGIVAHGGGIEVVDFDEKSGVLSVRMLGMCVGCPMANITLKEGIEEVVCSTIPEVKEVVAV